ncbi:MAG: NAD(P)H nitroreductase [Actinophytocola sp.]|uniref:Acg family FMN-binding oxidoreductase n=1 Tax=Actinophytocola sp. TaxID=1872138 RepID=UPI001320F6F7|nr:NAD(P)H nitroreductase [Actinophytocola sp.]MPZ79026.1 NAD(P)H nitroreductase [Actinophytocola sp.]
MTATRPDHQTVHRAIALASRAPSVHNTQPWRWLLGNHTLHLMADRTRHLPATDPDGRDLLISCGAMLHHLCVALAALGWGSKVHHIPNGGDPAHLAAVEPHLRPPAEQDIALAAAIPRRRTDRRRFSSWPVPPGHLELMAQRARQAGALLVPVTTDLRCQLTDAIAEATTRQESSPEYSSELALWSGRGSLAADGVLAGSTPGRSSIHGDTRMRTFPGGILAEPPGEDQEDDAGELLVLATRTDDPKSRLRAGEAASAVLLTATDLMLATCPLSQALEVADTRAKIQEHVLGGAAVPQLILRVGWAPVAAEPLPRTPRRPMEEITGLLPGTGSQHLGN